MNDAADRPRPAPQFGEYATPEQQRERIQQPDASWAIDSGNAPDDAERTAPAAAVAADERREPAGRVISPRTRMVDRVLTIGLLVYGLFTVLTTIPALTDYGTYSETLLEMLGVDAEVADPAAGQPWAIAAALVLGLGWLITAAASWGWLRRGHMSFWIPLVGGVLFTAISSVLLIVPLMNDPDVWNALVGVIG
ncbi:DUF6264 family protein [Microbacterium sp. LRZ72]|uniref:DUF6264 family protein n=1 Tax=Microbacterium sp. LRZ72 TaxID=2942481 RepID=UPI0029ABDD79|nr:DUF6264 family protein [Microbacterium sp. LRZ72]MDX2375797.1 DUF6264 family protein [Microbacterium sp. LRZ72]